MVLADSCTDRIAERGKRKRAIAAMEVDYEGAFVADHAGRFSLISPH
jgi:hypothetical protein